MYIIWEIMIVATIGMEKRHGIIMDPMGDINCDRKLMRHSKLN